MSKQWYALRSQPHKERAVSQWLNNEQIDCYLPLVRVKPKNPRAAKVRPYFPGYLFVHVDLRQLGENRLNRMYGVVGLVMFGGQPAAVPNHLIGQLQQHLDQMERNGGFALNGLKKGDHVRIVSGPLQGYEAVFDMQLKGNDRVQILLSYLSQLPKRVRLSADQIEKIK